MYLVTAIIKPIKLEAVREALEEAKITGISVSEVKGHSSRHGHKEVYRGVEYMVDLLKNLKIEIALREDQVDKVIEIIQKAAQTGDFRDGVIFAVNLDRMVRIGTGESDENAL